MKLDKVISIITLRDVVREAMVFGVCFLVAFALSIYAVLHYQTEWKELYTDIGYTMALAAIIYAARCLFKALTIVVWKIVCKFRQRKQNAYNKLKQ